MTPAEARSLLVEDIKTSLRLNTRLGDTPELRGEAAAMLKRIDENLPLVPTVTRRMCRYCCTVRDESEMHEQTIIPHSNQPQNAGPHWYCKDKPCATYDQMASEG